jgi:hypothetical protein
MYTCLLRAAKRNRREDRKEDGREDGEKIGEQDTKARGRRPFLEYAILGKTCRGTEQPPVGIL